MIDKKTCGILFEKYHSYVYDFCYKYLGNIHATEDCTQEVFMIMLKKKNNIDLTENFLSWLYETSKRVCKKYIRNNPNKFLDIDDYAETISDTNISIEKPLSDKIYEILDNDDADLLFEYINADYGDRQKIAERVGVTPPALYQRIKRLKKKVVDYLNEE